MNKQTLKFMAVLLFALLVSQGVNAQSNKTYLHNDGESHTVAYVGSEIQDFYIPEQPGYDYLYLEARGADGGTRVVKEAWGTVRFRVSAGSGATMTASFKIGSKTGELRPGSLIRMIVGGKGESRTSQGKIGAGGGGGTAVLYKAPNQSLSEFKILLVAGGGSGAYSDCCLLKNTGISAVTGTSGTSGDEGEKGGKDGHGGQGNDGSAGAGGGAFSAGGDGSMEHGGAGGGTDDPHGGRGGYKDSNAFTFDSFSEGGYGYGAGGQGTGASGGGGGGYSGGGAGPGEDHGTGGGGGSFANTDLARAFKGIVNGTTNNSRNGQVMYHFSNTSPAKRIRLAKALTNCIDLTGGDTTNGTNIQLCPYLDQAAQQWYVGNSGIRLTNDLDKCLDLANSNTANGTNIQLYDCNGTKAQDWIYDVANQMIRSSIALSKCLDVVDGKTAIGTNIQLYDCDFGSGKSNQQWIVDGIISAMPTAANQSIRLVADSGKCLDVDHSNTANGTNIQLWDCNGTNAQYFTFDGHRISLQSAPGKCLDLDHSSTNNGTNLQLWDCNGTDAQKWIYDGFAQTFRSAIDPGKCLDVDHSNFNDGTNIQLWDCNGTDAQRFEIY